MNTKLDVLPQKEQAGIGFISTYPISIPSFVKLLEILTLLHITGVIFLLISTSMIIQSCVNIRNYKVLNFDTCREIKKLTSTSCSVCEGSAAAGFLALIVLVFDTYLHCLKYLDIKRRLAIAKEEEEKNKEKLPSP
nr:uncharacterized protein LOC100206273 isoform X2 [Hydra vulgaris]